MKKLITIPFLLLATLIVAQQKVGIGTSNPQKMLSVQSGMNLDQENAGDGNSLLNGLSFGFSSNTGIASDRTSLSFFTNGIKRVIINSTGIGIGAMPNNAMLQMDHLGSYNLYDFSKNAHAIKISARTTGAEQSLLIGADAANHVSYILADSSFMYPTGSVLVLQGRGGRLSVGNILKPTYKLEVDGTARLVGNLLVRGDKGIIRSQDSTQKKMISTNVVINYSVTPIAANGTVFKDILWNEPFAAAPVAYVGNFGGAGGWAEVIVSVALVSATGCRVYVYNPKPSDTYPSFNVNIVAIGGQ
jgi:hypothetical protein